MTDLESIMYTKHRIDRMVQGIHPFSDTFIPDGEVASDERVVECFRQVSELLGQMIERQLVQEEKKKRMQRAYFSITPAQLSRFPYTDELITTGEFCRRLELLVDLRRMRRISRASLPLWLVHKGILNPPRKGERHYAGDPTLLGRSVGFSQISVSDERGTHVVTVMNLHAQRFVVERMEEFMTFRANRGR